MQYGITSRPSLARLAVIDGMVVRETEVPSPQGDVVIALPGTESGTPSVLVGVDTEVL
jgi:hypothetical protein